MRVKADKAIGHRAFEFFNAQPEGVINYCKKVGISQNTVYAWLHGNTPSVYFIIKLGELGADMNYILTGEKK